MSRQVTDVSQGLLQGFDAHDTGEYRAHKPEMQGPLVGVSACVQKQSGLGWGSCGTSLVKACAIKSGEANGVEERLLCSLVLYLLEAYYY